MDVLSSKYIPLPRGCTSLTLSVAREFVARYGMDSLPLVGKMHFKTVRLI